MFEIKKHVLARPSLLIKFVVAPLLAFLLLFFVFFGSSWLIGKLILVARSLGTKYNLIKIIPPPGK